MAMRKYILIAQGIMIGSLSLMIKVYGVTKLNITALTLLLISTGLNLWEARKNAKR